MLKVFSSLRKWMSSFLAESNSTSIIGRAKIGDNVRIEENCVVMKDIPDNSTVVMNAPRIIVKDTLQDNSFVEFNREAD